MKILNYTTSWFALILFLILSVWATIFYFDILDEIYDSIDDGLANQKLLVIHKAARDPSVLERKEFEDGYYKIREIPATEAIGFTDTYLDTLMYMEYEEDYEPVRMLETVFRKNGRYYKMSVITSMVEEDDLIEHLLLALLLLYLGLLGSTIFLNKYLLRTIWKPFYQLLEQLRQFRLDRPESIGDIKTNIEEFRLLNTSIHRLLESNIRTFNSQKQFIENASHELQTPLAISLNKLEMLAENYPQDEEALLLLSSAMDNLQRLTRLNKSLLLLSRISNRQFHADAEINLLPLLQKLSGDFSDLAAHREITLTIGKMEDCPQKMNPELAGILISNLLKNAIIHNHRGGTVNINLYKDSLQIRNSGPAESLDESQVFARFHKGEASTKSTGLGLAIVKAIVELYGFDIHYRYNNGEHSMLVQF